MWVKFLSYIYKKNMHKNRIFQKKTTKSWTKWSSRKKKQFTLNVSTITDVQLSVLKNGFQVCDIYSLRKLSFCVRRTFIFAILF